MSYALSISDDDLCSDCVRLIYRPGEESECMYTPAEYGEWPAEFNKDGYAVSCDMFFEVNNKGDNWDREIAVP